MSGNDLFSFLDDEDNDDEQNIVETEDAAPPNSPPSAGPSAMDVDGATSTSPSSKKRKANASPTSPAFPPTNGSTNNDNGMHEVAMDEEEDAGPSSLKKPRIAEPSPVPFVQPVVVDEFETEAKREVAASAGLTGSTEAAGSRLELKHQVCCTHAQFTSRSRGCQCNWLATTRMAHVHCSEDDGFSLVISCGYARLLCLLRIT